ncbi:hypothetical protein G6O69_00305 [Pseudenhygromyxa sp. WMMC2535]|uniref:hypothetical protein n=1 Tax=Pseudenhygromyxa sp. WMMC2535 TaxID=2712867 RepID=UPI0015543383|nr:hypothetical protein [Pseudenhygromyxa sp. WMMC2535]NVB36251.1 hypothetical protein [Pseudenhygromyxa sp. WMMC2535]
MPALLLAFPLVALMSEPAPAPASVPLAPEPALEPFEIVPAEPAPEPEHDHEAEHGHEAAVEHAVEHAVEQEALASTPAPSVDRLGCTTKPCRSMTIAGISVGALAISAVGVGVALLSLPDELVAARPAFVTSTRPAGMVTTTIGAAVTVTAVLMIVAAHQRSGRGAAQARRIELSPAGLRF